MTTMSNTSGMPNTFVRGGSGGPHSEQGPDLRPEAYTRVHQRQPPAGPLGMRPTVSPSLPYDREAAKPSDSDDAKDSNRKPQLLWALGCNRESLARALAILRGIQKDRLTKAALAAPTCTFHSINDITLSP